MHTMLCEKGSGSKHKAYIEAISCNLDSLHGHVSGLTHASKDMVYYQLHVSPNSQDDIGLSHYKIYGKTWPESLLIGISVTRKFV